MRSVVVETGLTEEAEWRGQCYVRHARTRFVENGADPGKPREPRLGDRWEPLTVRARLLRTAEVFRKLPHTPDTRPQSYRSCMPTPVRELFKDLPGEPMRLPVPADDYAAARQVLDSLLKFRTDEQRLAIWGVATRRSHREMGRYLHKGKDYAASLAQRILQLLAEDWNERGWSPDAADIDRAADLIHRNFK